MQRRNRAVRMVICGLFLISLIVTVAVEANAGDAVNVILKNSSSTTIEVEMLDQYGGNVTTSIDSGTSQNHSVKANSELKVKDGMSRTVTADDEGREIELGGQ